MIVQDTRWRHALTPRLRSPRNLRTQVALNPLSLGSADLYAQNALSALLEAPAYLLMACADSFGRRRTWACFLIVAALPLLFLDHLSNRPLPSMSPASRTSPPPYSSPNVSSAAPPPPLPGRHYQPLAAAPGMVWVVTLLSLLARFGATGASAIAYVAAAEQWPTTCRNLGVNYGASCGRVGSIISPFAVLLPSPSVALGVVGAAAALAVLALPETAGQAIPDTIESNSREAAAAGVFVGDDAGRGDAAGEATSSEQQQQQQHQHQQQQQQQLGGPMVVSTAMRGDAAKSRAHDTGVQLVRLLGSGTTTRSDAEQPPDR